VAVVEEPEPVYRSAPVPRALPPSPAAAPTDADWRREVRAGEVLLFRYSALTFNGHRIHYDRRYATGVEGYPGLVVHGQLIATMLLELLGRNLPSAVVTEFSFRAVRPLFDVAPFWVCGRRDTASGARLWAADAEGALAMQAAATLA
jgi:3-methylfumaryl-CoA hydratase